MGRRDPRDLLGEISESITQSRANTPPQAWEGQRVEVGLVVPGGFDQNTYARRPLGGMVAEGVLTSVTDNGIFGAFVEDTSERGEQTFYPWSAVLYIKPLRS